MGTIKNRNSGIELLRILAILMVICLHRAGNDTLQSAPMYSVSYYVLWFIQIASYKAVDIFFLICGFFSVKQTLKPEKLLRMEWKVLTYFLLVYGLAVAVGYIPFSARDLLRGFFPWIGGHYWYYTAYVSLLLLTPWINKLISGMSQKQHLLLVLILCGTMAVPVGDAFFAMDGYSAIWAIALYLLGSYLRLYVRPIKAKTGMGLSFACTIFSFLWFVLVGLATDRLLGRQLLHTHFLVYTRVPVVLSAVFAVLGFGQLNMKALPTKVINAVSRHTFGVYLLHSCVFMDVLFWKRLFPAEPMAQSPWYFLYVIGSVLVMYTVCLAADWLRDLLFAPLEKSRFFSILGQKAENTVRRILDRLTKKQENEA